MTRWRPQSFKKNGKSRGVDNDVLNRATDIGKAITSANPKVQPVFTLRHLAHVADVDYGVLRAVVSRSIDAYRAFRIKKRPSSSGEQRFRVIAVPSPHLMKVQRWILQNILQYVDVHPASVAYSKDDNILEAAAPTPRVVGSSSSISKTSLNRSVRLLFTAFFKRCILSLSSRLRWRDFALA
jgi:RNA-directed DNA polymerase